MQRQDLHTRLHWFNKKKKKKEKAGEGEKITKREEEGRREEAQAGSKQPGGETH